MRVISFRVRLASPVLATAPGGDAGTETSHLHLPGSLFRGIVAGRLLAKYGDADLAGSSVARRLLFDGAVRFLNAYPELDGARSLPTPRSWKRVAATTGDVRDLASDEGGGAPVKSFGKPFSIRQRVGSTCTTPERRLQIHIRRGRRAGRPTATDGALFQYDALAAGQTFVGAVLCETDDDLHLVRELLETSPNLRLGGSRTAEYGTATLLDVRDESAAWQESNGASFEGGSKFCVVLNSPLILVDGFGDPTIDPSDVARAIGRVLNTPGVRLATSYIRTETVGGFNRAWGLPLPQSPAISMGSVLVCESDGQLDREKLRQMEAAGLGLRRTEGFGRISVVRMPQGNVEILEQVKEAGGVGTISIEDDGIGARGMAQAMLQRMLVLRLDERLTSKAVSLADQGFKKLPSPSQLGSLRAIISKAIAIGPAEGGRQLNAYLDSLDSRQTSRMAFLRARVEGRPLRQWLKERAADESTALSEGIWQILGVQREDLPKLGDLTAQLSPTLAFEYGLLLAHEAIRLAAKKNRR